MNHGLEKDVGFELLFKEFEHSMLGAMLGIPLPSPMDTLCLPFTCLLWEEGNSRESLQSHRLPLYQGEKNPCLKC